MRLLDTTTKRLKTFYGEYIPEYAILSHMWGREEDEVLFKHIAGSDADRREGEMRKGYAKVEGACAQAIADGWKYIWIDTCCIDKGSSAELSEAINSMYEWYEFSGACYVYLEDVRSDVDGQPESDEDTMFPIVPFERSRWFSRGWTLQELIAPRYVVFYSKDWVDLGTKTGPLRDTISSVTRIRVEMLIAYDPENVSIAERMSWAAYRKTTRAEDMAYCLMGLLGVNMPLLYGEGDKAFRRLQEEIMKVSDDDSLFAWKDRLSSDRGMLAASPWYFRDGMNIARSKNGAYAPYSMTNQGLEIKLPLLAIDPKSNSISIDSDNIFKTVLKCTIRDKGPTRWIVIYLEKIREGYYQRIFTDWLDETEAHLDEMALTSLLVPQVSVPTAHYFPVPRNIEVEVLPTESGFIIDGQSLVEGYKYNDDLYYGNYDVIYFEHPTKRFGVAIGSDNGVPWLDFVDAVDEKQSIYNSYDEGGSRAYVQERHLDRLSEKIPGEDWWVTVSVRKTSHGQDDPGLRAFIDIQRAPIRAKGWYTPSVMSAHATFSGNFLGNLDHYNVHPDFKKERHDWLAVFNPEVKRVLDVSLIYTLPYTESLVHCVQFSHDGKYLALGGNIVRVFDMETGAETCTLANKSTTITDFMIYASICFSPDGKFLATGDNNGLVQLWDIDAKRVQKVFNGHKQSVDSLCFSPDARLLISGSRDGTVRIWDIVDGTCRILTEHSFRSHKACIAISPHGELIATQGDGGVIQIWDMITTKKLAELPENYCMHIAFTPDGKGLVNGSADATLKYWDVSELATPTGVKRNSEENKYTITFRGHKNTVNSVAVSHDGRWFVSGSEDNSVLFWDLENVTAQFMLRARRTRLVHSVEMNPVGNIFATVSGDDRVEVWRYDDI